MAGQREILSGVALIHILQDILSWELRKKDDKICLPGFAGIKLEDVRGIRAPFLAIGGNHFFLNLIRRLIWSQLIISEDKTQETQCSRCCTRPTSRMTRRCRSTRTNPPPSPTPWTTSWPMTAWSPLAPTGRWQCWCRSTCKWCLCWLQLGPTPECGRFRWWCGTTWRRDGAAWPTLATTQALPRW